METNSLINIPQINLNKSVYLRRLMLTDIKELYDLHQIDGLYKDLPYSKFTSFEDYYHYCYQIYLQRPIRNMPLPHVIINNKTQKIIGYVNLTNYRPDIKQAVLLYALHPSFYNEELITRLIYQYIRFCMYFLGLNKLFAQHRKLDNINKRALENNNFVYISTGYDESIFTEVMYYYISKEHFYQKEDK